MLTTTINKTQVKYTEDRHYFIMVNKVWERGTLKKISEYLSISPKLLKEKLQESKIKHHETIEKNCIRMKYNQALAFVFLFNGRKMLYGKRWSITSKLVYWSSKAWFIGGQLGLSQDQIKEDLKNATSANGVNPMANNA